LYIASLDEDKQDKRGSLPLGNLLIPYVNREGDEEGFKHIHVSPLIPGSDRESIHHTGERRYPVVICLHPLWA